MIIMKILMKQFKQKMQIIPFNIIFDMFNPILKELLIRGRKR